LAFGLPIIFLSKNDINVQLFKFLTTSIHFTPMKFIDVYAGAYIGIVVINNQEWFYTSGLEEREDSSLRQFDAGWRLGTTVWLKRIGIGLEYYNGIINTDTITGPEFVFTNRAFSLVGKYLIE